MVQSLIGLGSNLGDPGANLEAGRIRLASLPKTKLLLVSDWLSTQPVGGPQGQSEFLNGVALLDTELSPQELASHLQQIEANLGRQRIVRWGPRLIDLDIVLYGDQVVATADLTIPHAWMAVRRFVIKPALEIVPHMVHPQVGWSISKLWDNLIRQPSRIELTGLPGVDTAAVASWLASELGGRLIYPAKMPREASWDLVRGPSIGSAIELLQVWSAAASSVTAAEVADSKPLFWIGDRCCEEILAAGSVVLDAQEFRQLFDAGQLVDNERKLLVVLTDPTQKNDACLVDAFWHQIQSPGHGPWLELDCSDPKKMRHDLLAAVDGMK